MNTFADKSPTKKSIAGTSVNQKKSVNTAGAKLTDNRPKSIAQLQQKENSNHSLVEPKDFSINQVGKSSEIAQLSGKGGGGNNKKQEKAKAAAKSKASSDQSKKDRNALRVLQYETTSKKDASAKQDAARKFKGNLAHGTGDSSSGKQGKTKAGLKKINAEVAKKQAADKLAKRQASANKKHQDWLDRKDRDDRGGAGGGFGVLV